MARKYSRDNRGRFSSVGATARGGRLKTASGKKRATQTMTAAASKPSGALTGRAARTFAGQKAMAKLAKRPVGQRKALNQTGAERRLGRYTTMQSSVATGAIGKTKSARDRNRSDTKWVSLTKAREMGVAQRRAAMESKKKPAAKKPSSRKKRSTK